MTHRLAALPLVAALLCAPAARTQSAPATDAVPAPRSLLTAPRDPLAYAAMRERSRELYTKKEYAAAEPLLLQLTRDYPRDGENWAFLGAVERRLNKFAEAAAANARATSILGWDYPSYTEFSEAAAYVSAGDKPRALATLRRMMFEHHGQMRGSLYNQPALAALRTDPEFLRLIGRPDTTGWTRTQGWRRDIDFVYEEVKRISPDLRDSLPPEFTRRYQELKRDVPKRTDEQIWIGLNRMLATLRASGHTGLWGNAPFKITQLPLQLWVFPEGIFIIDAVPEHEGLIGSRLVAIGGVNAETAMQRIGELVSIDGDMDYLRWPILLLTELTVLKALDILPSADSATLTLESPTGARQDVRLGTADANRQSVLLLPHGVAPQLFLKNPAIRHWEMPMPEHDAHYVRLREVRDDSAETLAAFGLRLRTVLNGSTAKNLIFDVRGNRGGSTALYTELLRTLVAFSTGEGHHMYILIDRNTYSATGNLITELERLANPVFVGEPSGQCCNLHGDATWIRLPWSGIEGGISAVRWNLSHPWDRRREMVPQVPVQLTASDYFAGRDPALQAVYALIRSAK